MALSTTNHWKLGLFVTVGILLSLGALTWLGLDRLERKYVVQHYYFDETVDGLSVGSPVKFRGVTLGNVMEINAAPDKRHVQVVAAIYKDQMEKLGLPALDRERSLDELDYVPSGLRVQLNRSLLTGVTFIQGDFFDPEKYPLPVYPFPVPYNTVHSVPSTYKSIESGLTEIVDRLPGLADQSSDLMARIELALDELALRELSERTRHLLRTLEERVSGLEGLQVVQRMEATLSVAHDAAEEIRALTAELREEQGPIRRLARHYEGVGRILEEEIGATRLADTAAAMRTMSASAAAASDELAAAGADLRVVLASLRSLLDLLERDPAALLYGRTPSDVLEGHR